MSNLVKCNITVVATGADEVSQVEFKNYAEFFKC